MPEMSKLDLEINGRILMTKLLGAACRFTAHATDREVEWQASTPHDGTLHIHMGSGHRPRQLKVTIQVEEMPADWNLIDPKDADACTGGD